MESLRGSPIRCSRKRRLSEAVAAGRCFTSSSRSFAAVSSIFGAPGALPRSQGPPLLGHPGVALDRGETHTEEASGPSFGYPAFYGFDYLAAEVYRPGSHSPMIALRSIVLTDAVSLCFNHEEFWVVSLLRVEDLWADYR